MGVNVFSFIKKQTQIHADFWSVSSLILAILILTPLAIVVLGVTQTGPEWSHINETVLGTYVSNTIILVCAATLLSLLIAVPTAWLVSVFDFPGRKFFEWGLIMPLAVPTYVAAFAYIDIPEMAIPLLVTIKNNYGFEVYETVEQVLRYGVLSMLLAAVLYPYLYISARFSFAKQQTLFIEAARTLGRSPVYIFLTLAIPLARPAIVAGVSLIIMEVVNDYGAVHFFGVPTMTEGIFRSWFGLEDRLSALRLSGFVIVAVLLLLLFEKWQRGRAHYSSIGTDKPRQKQRLRGKSSWIATLLCLIPFSIGFAIPLFRLISWSVSTIEEDLSGILSGILPSVILALLTAVFLTAIALLFTYARKLHNVPWLKAVWRAATMGYAMPGAVVALGVMMFFSWIDSQIDFILISGTGFAICFAYLVRFLAVPYQPLSAGMTQVCGNFDEASRVLGKGKFSTFKQIILPLMRGSIVASTMLVFIDILKELPLTLILRPANFDTLATVAFGLANEGRIQESAIPSLIIVILGAIALVILNKFLQDKFQ